MPLSSARSAIISGLAGDPELAALIEAVENDDFGSAHFDGFYVGVIDTQQGNIIAADQWQTGERYALIVCPQSYEKNSNLQWRTSRTATNVNTLAFTRWNGLGATRTLLANETVAQFPVFEYCEQINNNTATGLRGSPANTSPSRPDLIAKGVASEWYVPALDELGLMYWRLKPRTEDNTVGTPTARDFPDPNSSAHGFNPSSDPTFTAHTATVPAQTSIVAFQDGGAQALDSPTVSETVYRYWSSTEASSDRAWDQLFGSTNPGLQIAITKDNTNIRPRLARRVQL